MSGETMISKIIMVGMWCSYIGLLTLILLYCVRQAWRDR